MATRSEVHSWMALLMGCTSPHLAGDSSAAEMVAAATCIYLAGQDGPPDVETILGLQAQGIGSAPHGEDQGLLLTIQEQTYHVPRLPDLECCPVSRLGNIVMMLSKDIFLSEADTFLRKYLFSTSPNRSTPMPLHSYCRLMAGAMFGQHHLSKTDEEVLALLHRTRAALTSELESVGPAWQPSGC